MARGPRLSAAPGRRLALMVVAVLAGHAAVIEWMARQQAEAAALRLLPAPMYTRMLTLQAPPPVALAREQKPAPAPIRRGPVAIKSVAKEPSTPAVTPTVAQAEPPVPAAPEPVASVPAPATATATVAAATPTAAPSPSLDSWPTDTRLTYRLSGRYRSGELYGDAKVRWQRDGDRYQVQLDVDTTFRRVVMTSQGEVTEAGLVPRAFEELSGKRLRSVKLGDTVIALDNGRSVERPAAVQDTASQFVELSHRFATGRQPLEIGRSVSVWMARPGAVDHWTYDITDREILQTPKLGAIDSFHLKPRPLANPRGNIYAEMWFAPGLQYLPVRIRLTMGDEAEIDLVVETIEQR